MIQSLQRDETPYVPPERGNYCIPGKGSRPCHAEDKEAVLRQKMFALLSVISACAVIASGLSSCSSGGSGSEATYSYKYSGSDLSSSEVSAAMTHTQAQETSDVEITDGSGEIIGTSVYTYTVAQTQAADVGGADDGNVGGEPAAETTTQFNGDAKLNITLPSANGEMHFSQSASNKFIAIVNASREIDASLLVSVYSLPDTGQNYVLEFNGSTDGAGRLVRTADTLRRVYLIDTSGAIKYVAAASSDETENVSSVENWFCMEVIMKQMIMPEIADDLA